MGEEWAAGLKTLADYRQSANYCHQLLWRLIGQHAQRLLPRTDANGPITLAYTIWGNSAVQRRRRDIFMYLVNSISMPFLLEKPRMSRHISKCSSHTNRGTREQTGDNLKVVWAEFSTLSWAVSLILGFSKAGITSIT